MKPVVYIPEPIAASGLNLLKAECDCLAPWEVGGPNQAGDPRTLLLKADAVIVRLFRIEAADIRSARRLKVIGKHGVGLDNIDIRTATAERIPVVYTPEANANAVAEHTLALMLVLARRIAPANAALLTGRFGDRHLFQGVELAGKTLGLIGLGRIGARVAEMASFGLGMKVHAYDPFIAEDNYEGPAVLEEPLEALVGKADFLSLHVTLTPETHHLINDHLFAMLKPGCNIVNTSRGSVIDETALVRALQDGRVGGAALDVFEDEPLPADHPLTQAPNTLLTPHIASSTQESLERMSLHVAQGVLAVLQGRRPEHLANPETM